MWTVPKHCPPSQHCVHDIPDRCTLLFRGRDTHNIFQTECLYIRDSHLVLHNKYSRGVGHDLVRCNEALPLSSAKRIHTCTNTVCLRSDPNSVLLHLGNSVPVGNSRRIHNDQHCLCFQYDHLGFVDKSLCRDGVQEHVAWLGQEHA